MLRLLLWRRLLPLLLPPLLQQLLLLSVILQLDTFGLSPLAFLFWALVGLLLLLMMLQASPVMLPFHGEIFFRDMGVP